MSAMRPDGHPGTVARGPDSGDCLHYCMPGPIDAWVDVFYNVLLELQSCSDH